MVTQELYISTASKREEPDFGFLIPYTYFSNKMKVTDTSTILMQYC